MEAAVVLAMGRYRTTSNCNNKRHRPSRYIGSSKSFKVFVIIIRGLFCRQECPVNLSGPVLQLDQTLRFACPWTPLSQSNWHVDQCPTPSSLLFPSFLAASYRSVTSCSCLILLHLAAFSVCRLTSLRQESFVGAVTHRRVEKVALFL